MPHAPKTIAEQDKEIRQFLLSGLEKLQKAAIRRLANRKIDQFFTRDEALAVIRSLKLPKGNWPELADRLLVEWAAQQKPHAERGALKRYVATRQETVLVKLGKADDADVEPQTRRAIKQDFAELHFGAFVKGVFADQVIDVLAQMQHERRSWRIEWLDVAAKPAISALIRVTVVNEKHEEKGHGLFLVYKIPGSSRIVAIETGGVETCRDAFAGEVPEMAITLKAKGFTFKTDFEQQALIATSPDGAQSFVLHWQGKALCTG